MERLQTKGTIADGVGVIVGVIVCVWYHDRVVPSKTPGRGEQEDVPAALQERQRLREQTSVSV